MYSGIWFKNKGKQNYMHVIGASYENYDNNNVYGLSKQQDNYLFIYIQMITDNYPTTGATVNADTVAHELGHQFYLARTSVDANHPAGVWCHLGPNTDYCVMSYQADADDEYSELCHVHGTSNHMDDIRDATDTL